MDQTKPEHLDPNNLATTPFEEIVAAIVDAVVNVKPDERTNFAQVERAVACVREYHRRKGSAVKLSVDLEPFLTVEKMWHAATRDPPASVAPLMESVPE